jgi:hypothetical protein
MLMKGHNPRRCACQVTKRKVQVTKWRRELSAAVAFDCRSRLIKSGALDDNRCYLVSRPHISSQF